MHFDHVGPVNRGACCSPMLSNKFFGEGFGLENYCPRDFETISHCLLGIPIYYSDSVKYLLIFSFTDS